MMAISSQFIFTSLMALLKAAGALHGKVVVIFTLRFAPSLYSSPSTGEGGVGVIFIFRCAGNQAIGSTNGLTSDILKRMAARIIAAA